MIHQILPIVSCFTLSHPSNADNYIGKCVCDVTLPNWLNIEAEKAHINVSKVLQEALKEKLQVAR